MLLSERNLRVAVLAAARFLEAGYEEMDRQDKTLAKMQAKYLLLPCMARIPDKPAESETYSEYILNSDLTDIFHAAARDLFVDFIRQNEDHEDKTDLEIVALFSVDKIETLADDIEALFEIAMEAVDDPVYPLEDVDNPNIRSLEDLLGLFDEIDLNLELKNLGS